MYLWQRTYEKDTNPYKEGSTHEMNLKCRLGWHQWDDWSYPERRPLAVGNSNDKYQHRNCTQCKLAQERNTNVESNSSRIGSSS